MRAAFYKGTRPGWQGMYNRLVRLWTRGKYSHMELVLNDSGLSGSSSFVDGGVRCKFIEYSESNWDFLELSVPLSAQLRVLVWLNGHHGAAYDFWGNIRFMLGFIPHSKDKYQCAEACMEALGFEDAWRFEPNSAYATLKFIGKNHVQ